MPFLSFADNSAMYDATPLDNMFIIENLPTAPENFLKVYIYARMLCLHPEIGNGEELERALGIDEATVENAMNYWERQGLVRRVADQPPEYVFLSASLRSAVECTLILLTSVITLPGAIFS